MLEVYTYNAGKGDSIRIRYGDAPDRIHNIFIDTGVTRFAPVFRDICNEILLAGESLDILILTHVDNDHIGGILSILRCGCRCPFQEVWMNHKGTGYVGDAALSTKENDEVYGRLTGQGMKIRPMVMGDTRLAAGAVITALNPESSDLTRAPEASDTADIRRDVLLARHRDYGTPLSGLAARPITGRDTSLNNKNSIVCIFEYECRRLLFTGDAWAEDVAKASGEFDLIKLPHHGSVRNISEKYRECFRSENFLICTDGGDHPDKQTIAKLENWYGEINIYSPVAWWKNGYFIGDDKSHKVHYHQKEGLVIAW